MMGSYKRRWCAFAVLFLPVVTACSPSVPSPSSSRPLPSATPVSIGIEVTISGTIGCATFPYSCTVALSVVEPGTTLSSSWRPAATDPWWGPDWSPGMHATRLDPTVRGNLPSLVPGDHTLVVSILGSSDTPSFNPDGSIATDLIGRCQTETGVGSSATRLIVTILLTPGETGLDTSCSVAAMPGSA